MKKISIYISLLIVTIIFSSCATIYLAPNGQSISNKHEEIAILKPKVSIKARKKMIQNQ